MLSWCKNNNVAVTIPDLRVDLRRLVGHCEVDLKVGSLVIDVCGFNMEAVIFSNGWHSF